MVTERLKRQNERLLDEAEKAVGDLNWDVVRDRALAVLAFEPDNADAKAFLSAVARALGVQPSVQPSVQFPVYPPVQPSVGFGVPLGQVSSDFTPVTESQPTQSFFGGRYPVIRLLGEGGKKRVYLATDTMQKREVAFALFKSEHLDEVSRNRIKRDTLAMGVMGSHPHIVTIFHIGEHNGQPFMVTEVMEGGDLERILEDAPDHRLPVEQAISITRDICRGLEFAHSRGIVHRDLKPGNVWLTGDGTAKVGDFGLDVAKAALMVGAVSYMPPEKARGEGVTARSDLYSLGAMLYEMVTGRHPFSGDNSEAIIWQHINTLPVVPSRHNPECPHLLETLIMWLLAKDPQERPASAADVLSALDAIDVADVETSLAYSPGVVGGRAVDDIPELDRLSGGLLVGRQQELNELKAAVEDTIAGSGKLVTLVGEPGIGKSRLVEELAGYAEMRGALVLWGRCYEEQGKPPYWPWVQAVRSYVLERDQEQLRSELGAGAADIAELVSEIRERLPESSPPPPVESPEQARSRLFDSITDFLMTASQRQPLVLVLDDLHWADQPSLLLLQFVAKELGGGRLLVLGTYQDTELLRQHPLAEILRELARDQLFQRMLLLGLSEPDVGRLIEVVTGIVPTQGLVRAVYAQTEGNPLFVTELVRLLVQEGRLTPERTGDGDSWTLRMAEGVREVVRRRLNLLSDRCKQALIVGAFIGREFSLSQLSPLMGALTLERLLEVMAEAIAAGVIEKLPQSVGLYEFSHSLMQETLIQELPDTGRVLLHARIAKALEELYRTDADAHAAELAYHFAQAEVVLGNDRLGHYSLLAGEQALAAHAWEDALGHFRRALDAKEGQPTDAETAAILFGLARSMCATVDKFRVEEIVAHLTRVFGYYEQSGVISGRAILNL